MFTQYFGGAVFICVARTVLTESITSAMGEFAPSVNPQLVIQTGITDLRTVIPPSLLSGVLLAYNKAIVDVFVRPLSPPPYLHNLGPASY